MYEYTKVVINTQNKSAEVLVRNKGVRQGRSISPDLFIHKWHNPKLERAFHKTIKFKIVKVLIFHLYAVLLFKQKENIYNIIYIKLQLSTAQARRQK